ncbi:MAG: hypothetical protein SHS37scaffold537_39 [Phage 68_12]|nr:MAG: hypothetical protein SHS37scaffold537_39 [Phage 68_12]
MSEGAGAWAVKVYGSPAPKGSMKCVGGRGRHQLVNNNPATTPWQDRVAKACELFEISEPLTVPLGLQLTFTVDRPKSVKPASRPWPHKTARTSDGGGGDVDKLARTVLDALEQARVVVNDAQICSIAASKVYPDTPDVADVLHRPGVFIRLYRL